MVGTVDVQPGFLTSVDGECFTAIPGREGVIERLIALEFLLDTQAGLMPSLPGPTGLFTGYGRIYPDAGHVELAAAECASPYGPPEILERLQRLVAQGVERLRERGIDVLLATCTHAGRLGPGTPSWGSHENYLIGVPPKRVADRLLPFLVTRVFAGAGAVWAPTGEFLAGARMTTLARDVGGNTGDERALFSTAREEHLCGGQPGLYRCHLILGDGHRSHLSLALQLGATALVLRAVECLPNRVLPIPRDGRGDQSRFWLAAAKEFNRLAGPDGRLQVHPLVVDIQQFYLDLAADFVARLSAPPAWTHRLLADWAEALVHLRAGDHDWLGARFDPWIKHRVFTAWLAARGARWEMVRSRGDLLDGLALLDQDYHTFTGPAPLFDRLEARGLISHRTGARIEPGCEPEPFVPDLGTRATARARFIRANDGGASLQMDWASVADRSSGRSRSLTDPFAKEFGPWRRPPGQD
jgi:hypothetical protein